MKADINLTFLSKAEKEQAIYYELIELSSIGLIKGLYKTNHGTYSVIVNGVSEPILVYTTTAKVYHRIYKNAKKFSYLKELKELLTSFQTDLSEIHSKKTGYIAKFKDNLELYGRIFLSEEELLAAFNNDPKSITIIKISF